MVDVDDLDSAMALYRHLEAEALPGIVDLVPAAATVLVEFDPDVVEAGALARRIEARSSLPAPAPPSETVRIPVVYDGPDLSFVAEVMGMAIPEFVRWHTSGRWTVAFGGFAPGFGYCVTEGERPDIPRLHAPRTAVPAGSVAMAGAFTGIYPRESPGGWRVIGRTDHVLWDEHRDPPAVLRPGVDLCFTATA